MSSRGRFIVFEGGEASGKSTQAGLLAKRLGARLTREPGGTPLGARLRDLLLDPATSVSPRAEALLMAADRAQHVAELIEPALSAGVDVVSDRFVGSSLAYQGYGRELGTSAVGALSEFAVGSVHADLVLLLDLPPEEVVRRLAGRDEGPDRLEAESRAFHRRVVQGYHELAAADRRWVVVDGRGTIEQVARRIDEVVRQRLPGRDPGTDGVSHG